MTRCSGRSPGGLIAKPLGIVLGVVALAVIIISSSLPLYSQEVTASITGTITDPSGAPIPNAKVTATDTLRGVSYPTETNQVGVFDLPRLPIGTYDVKVEAQGFGTAVQNGIVLQMNQRARLDLQLKVGAMTQTIEVTGGVPILQTDTMQVGTVITSRVNTDLPLATRNYVELTLLAPGVTQPDPKSLTNGQSTGFNGGRPYVNGNREQANNFLLDGLDNNQVSDNLVGYTPSMDAIQEFNMITNNAPAEFGNFEGGIVSVTLKSGTNQLHGVGFEFLRNNVLNAADWSQNIAKAPGTPDNKTQLRWNMFGGTVGGPIKKDKLFFFGDYQGERFITPAQTQFISVFTPKERAGDFSEICSAFDATGHCTAGVQLYNPYHVDASGNRVYIPYNNLPGAGLTMDPVAQKLFADTALYPMPISSGLVQNQTNAIGTRTIGDQFDVRIDANPTDKDRVFGRYSWSRQEIPGTNSFPLFFGSFSHTPTRNLALDWTRTISPRLVNEVRIGYNYIKANNGGTDAGLGNVGQELGIAGSNDRGPGLPRILFTGANVSDFGSANIGTQQLFPSTVIQAEDNLVITQGRHILHTGFQFWRERINPFYAGNYGRTGQIRFDGRWTAGPDNHSTKSATVGMPEADFWLGLPEYVQRGVDTGTWGQRANVIAGYIQDDWRATDDLTINLGLRYETHTPWGEVYNRQTNFGMISGTQYFAGKPGCPYSNCNALYNSYNGGFDFQPRIGFAWTPAAFKKTTVIRGAYTTSTYLEGTGTNLRLPLNPPNNMEHNALYDTMTFPGSTIDQGFTVFTAPANIFDNAVIRLWNPDVKPALAQQWNFSVERQFLRDTSLTVGYVGQHGTHLMVPMPYFQRQLLGTTTNPGTGQIVPVTAPSPFLSGNPELAGISQISGTESNGNMLYHALQATLKKRFSQGLQYQIAYSYSKCMTNSSGYYGSWGGQVTPTNAYWQNLYDMKAEWAPCYYDVTHMLSSYVVYEMPFGHKKHFGSNWNNVTNSMLGDWQVSGILQLRGGFPSTAWGGDSSGTNSRGMRADCIGPITYPKGSIPASNGGGAGIQWVDPGAFANPAVGTFGTCGNSVIQGPGLRTFDLSLQKVFPFTESKRLEFRAEFVNFTNTPILNAPGNTWVGSGFGTITSSQGARNIQFGLKLYY